MAEITIYVVASAVPDPNPTPTFPGVFLSEAEAEAYLEQALRSEWDHNAPEDDEGYALPYPGNWRDAQEAILKDRRGSDGEGWGSYELTIHRLEYPVSVLESLKAAIRAALAIILKPLKPAEA